MLQKPIPVILAGTRAFMVLVAVDLLLEFLANAVLGVSVKDHLKNVSFGMGFAVVYYLLLFVGMQLIMSFYVLIRPRFTTRIKAAAVTCAIMGAFALILTTQFANLGLMPMELFLISIVFNSIELPLAVGAGVLALKVS